MRSSITSNKSGHIHKFLECWSSNQTIRAGTSPLMGWMTFHQCWIRRQLELENGSGITSASSLSNNRLDAIPRRGGTATQSLPEYWTLVCRMLRLPTMNIRRHTPVSPPVLVHRCAAVANHCQVSLLILKWLSYLGLLSLLWAHAPEQSLEIDPVTKLYPFMLAAAVPFLSDRECEQRAWKRSLSTHSRHLDTWNIGTASQSTIYNLQLEKGSRLTLSI